jgi:acyl dehydratase
VPLDPDRVVALRRVADVVFKHPVYIGDTIHVEGRIESVTHVDGEHGLIESTWKVVTQRERTALRARVELLSRRVPVPAAELSELVMPL